MRKAVARSQKSVAVRRAKNNPDAISTFAQLAAGIASTLSIDESLRKRRTVKKKPAASSQKPAARRNPTPLRKPARSKGGTLTAAKRNPGGKRYNEQSNVGRAKYVVNFHDGNKTHADGSPFFDIRIFSNKVLKDRFVKSLIAKGYTYGWSRNPKPKNQNPKPAKRPLVIPRGGTLYMLTIGTGDDTFAVYLHDGKKDGFDKRFANIASARRYATKHRAKLVENPARFTPKRKRNVDGFVDDAGVFHPIRSSADYSGHAAGDHKPAPRRRADSKRNLIAAARRATDRGTYNRAMNRYKALTGHTTISRPKAFPAFAGDKKRRTPAVRAAVRKPARSKGVTRTAAAKQPTQGRLFNPALTPAEKQLVRALRDPHAGAAIANWSAERINKVAALLDKKGLLTSFGTLNSKGYAIADKIRRNPIKSLDLKGTDWKKLAAMATLAKDARSRATDAEIAAARKVLRSRGWTAAMLKTWENKRVSRRNPKTTARRPTYEMFQGRRATTERAMPVSRHAPARLDQLGDLVEIKIAGGPLLKFNPARVKLCVARGRMWIAGKRFADADPSQRANVINPIGEIDHVVYGTRKPHHGDHDYTHYIHRLGEDSGIRPVLSVDREGFPVITGGNYKIEARGIVD